MMLPLAVARPIHSSMVSALALAACLSLPARAADPAGAVVAADNVAGDEAVITVTATRTPTDAANVAATVSVITAEDIQNNLMEDIKDLVRFEPGIDVRTQPSRPGAAFGATGRDGNSGFTVRGLSGNRVLIQQDLIRLPDAFAFGAQSAGRGDYADLELLKSVEFLRGPASALYGSDGVAGAVSFTTRDPEDLIADGNSIGARARLGYTGADEGWTKSLMLAGRSGALSALIAYSRRDNGPARNFGTNDAEDATRTVPNPLEANSDSLLGKLVLDAGGGHKVRLTGELVRQETTSDVLSGRTPLPPSGVLPATAVLRLDLQDAIARDRISLDWRYTGSGLVDDAFLIVFRQTSRNRQISLEDRNTAADRTRDNRFDNKVTGINGQLALKFVTGAIGHRVLIGGDFSRTRQTGLRDGTVPPFGETFPTKAFPDTDYDQGGIFIQDSIDVADGRLLLYPSLRLDHYRLRAENDPLFPAQIAGQSGERLSPKLGAVGWITPAFGLFASYVEGFRSPTPSQVNNGFFNPASGYVAIPNADLCPETSRAFEGGVRLREARFGGVTLNGQITGFTARYRDFIDQVQVSGAFTPQNPAVFQFVNFARVSIEGIEAKLDAALGSGFGINFAAAWARGTSAGARPGQAAAETPLSPISPFNLVAGLNWLGLDKRLFVQAIATHSAAKRQADIAEACTPNCFASPAFTILDLTAAFSVTDKVQARIGIFNVTNRKYWWWNDVRGLAGTSPIADAFTMPGRNASASLIVRY
jgi:hemoglobin/transferrin/lactoferrin receptor protein